MRITWVGNIAATCKHAMHDLFPNSLQPKALGSDAIFYLWPTFFAIYPDMRDFPRILEWQRHICSRYTGIVRRPAKLLHVSVADCGNPKKRLQPMRDAFEHAAFRFSFPAFDIRFDALGRFGKDQDALVAQADAASQQRFDELRTALADALRHGGLLASRGKHHAHLTLGYAKDLLNECIPLEPFEFRVAAIDLIASDIGNSHHEHLERWQLTDGP